MVQPEGRRPSGANRNEVNVKLMDVNVRDPRRTFFLSCSVHAINNRIYRDVNV